jgi:small subunit ribosomal protein S15
MIAKEVKEQLIKKFGKQAGDNGSCEVQVALISERIRQISGHLKLFPKDAHSQRGLLMLVGQRRTFFRYIKKNNPKGHDALLKGLKENGYL